MKILDLLLIGIYNWLLKRYMCIAKKEMIYNKVNNKAIVINEKIASYMRRSDYYILLDASKILIIAVVVALFMVDALSESHLSPNYL